MKPFIIAVAATLSAITLFGCGGEGGVSTEESDVVAGHTPAVKWVTQNVDIDRLPENTTITLPYNIVDPDSDTFTVEAELTDHRDVDIYIDDTERTVTFTTPSVQADTTGELVITVTDDTGLQGQDTITLSVLETVNAAPTINVVFEQDTFREDDGVLVLYALNADDPDGDNDSLDITQTFYTDNPDTCLPVCTPITHTVVQHKGRYAATLDIELSDTITTLWLHATAEDLGTLSEDTASFNVEKSSDTLPGVDVTLEQSTIRYADPMHLAFNVDIEDDNDNIQVVNTLYMDDPATCRPICEPVSSTWSNYKTRNVGTFSLSLSDEDTPMWLNVLVTDGISETERHFPFTITKSANQAPVVEITLEKTTIRESDGLIVPYNLSIVDEDTPDYDLTLTQAVYTDNPETCLPICDALQVTWRQHNNRHVAYLDIALEHDETFWLLSTVSDGQYETSDIATFSVIKSVDTPPDVNVTIKDDSAKEDGGTISVEYTIDIYDSNPDAISLSQLIYDEDPTFCLPLCQPLSASYYEDGNRHAAEFAYDMETPSVTFWLNTTVTDDVNEVETNTPFTVTRTENTAPTVRVSLDDDVITEYDHLRYTIDMQDADGDNLSLAQNIYDDNPQTCRPVCSPVSTSWLQYEEKYAAEINYDFTAAATDLWLNVVVSDGIFNTESNTPFVVTKQENRAPNLYITLDNNSIIEGEALRYFIEMDDSDGDSLSLTQNLYDDNPETCRPVCRALSANWLQYEDRYAVEFDYNFVDENTTIWLNATVSDGIHNVEVNIPFNVEKIPNDPPSLAVVLSSNAIAEGDNLTYSVNTADADGDSVTLAQNLYRENPSNCRPGCDEVDASWSQNGTQHTLSINEELEDDVTTFWLEISASDGMDSTTETFSFTVSKYINAAPEVEVVLTSSAIKEGEDLLYSVQATDPEGDALTVTSMVYSSNPNNCLPSCQTMNFRVTNNGNNYTLTPQWAIDDPSMTAWLRVVVSDGTSETAVVAAFSIERIPDISIVFDNDTIPGNYPATLRYSLAYRDTGTVPSSVAQEIYWEDPTECVCNPIASAQSGSHPNYTATFYESYSSYYTTMWLELKVTIDGTVHTVVEPFTVRRN